MWRFKSICSNFTIKLRNSYKIYEVVNNEQCQAACSLLNSHCQNLAALGFDCEWITKNGVQRPVALLQLASSQGLCCLFRLNLMQNIPSDLENILTDHHIIKLGVSPLTDKKFLKHDYNVKVHGTLDLRHLYPNSRGLATLAQAVLGMKISRLSKLQCCNWENAELTREQKEFAAKDALVAIKIFQKWLLDHKDLPASESEVRTCEQAYKQLEKDINRQLDIPFRYF